jgi:tRNA(fMet)-specific endonuclease VapC
MRYLLDTNAMIGLLKDPSSSIARNAQRYRVHDVGWSAIVAYELYFGAFKSMDRARNIDRLNDIPLEIVPFDREDAEHAGEIRATLGAAGNPIGPYDVLIAGQARARGLILVTNNLREFRRVAGLATEDWTIRRD